MKFSVEFAHYSWCKEFAQFSTDSTYDVMAQLSCCSGLNMKCSFVLIKRCYIYTVYKHVQINSNISTYEMQFFVRKRKLLLLECTVEREREEERDRERQRERERREGW